MVPLMKTLIQNPVMMIIVEIQMNQEMKLKMKTLIKNPVMMILVEIQIFLLKW